LRGGVEDFLGFRFFLLESGEFSMAVSVEVRGPPVNHGEWLVLEALVAQLADDVRIIPNWTVVHQDRVDECASTHLASRADSYGPATLRSNWLRSSHARSLGLWLLPEWESARSTRVPYPTYFGVPEFVL
jgi:hypothetical protein